MAEITKLGPVRHLRSEVSSHVLHYKGTRLIHSGRGESFWFRPWDASLAEVPVDDRELALTFHGRSGDFQDVVVQGVVTYRIEDPVRAADRVDFSIDARKGTWLRQPLEKIAQILSQLAQQHALGYLQSMPVRDILTQGPQGLRAVIEDSLRPAGLAAEMGLSIVAVRISAVKPTSDLERALEAPTRENIQQEADQAAFRRRALAVEKERAIQENELQNQIELARREEQLIEQRGLNAQREATDKAEAARIESESRARDVRVSAEAQADSVRAVDGARVALDLQRMEAYRTMPPMVMAALAAQEVAGKIGSIQHLSLTPDLLGTLLGRLAEAGTRKLDGATGDT